MLGGHEGEGLVAEHEAQVCARNGWPLTWPLGASVLLSCPALSSYLSNHLRDTPAQHELHARAGGGQQEWGCGVGRAEDGHQDSESAPLARHVCSSLPPPVEGCVGCRSSSLCPWHELSVAAASRQLFARASGAELLLCLAAAPAPRYHPQTLPHEPAPAIPFAAQVEVALFFQREITQAAAASGSCTDASASTAAAAAALPVVLLSGDNAQIQLAKSHGLPAVRMGELAPLEDWLAAHCSGGSLPTTAVRAGPCLGASLVRELLGAAATLGEAASADRCLACCA